MTRRRTVLALLAVGVLAAGAAVTAASPSAPLTGDWQLIQARDAVGPFAVENAGISLTASGRTVGGYAGCGHYRARITGDPGRLTIRPEGDAAGSDEVCPERLEETRALYLAALESAASASVEGRTLRLRGEDTELVYLLAAPFPSAELTGTAWVLHSYGEPWRGVRNVPLVGTTTVRFSAGDGVSGGNRFSASLACRSSVGFLRVLGTEASVVAQNLTPSSAASTGFCPRPAQLQDDFVLHVLQGFRATVQGDWLKLTRDRREVVFRAAG